MASPSSKYCVSHSEIHGRGLFAAKTLDAGEEILTLDRPLIGVPDHANVENICNTCFGYRTRDGVDEYGTPASQLKACGACGFVRFCSKNCQTIAWKRYHKVECRQFQKKLDAPQKLSSKPITRAVIRLLAMKEQGTLSDEEWDRIQVLETHWNKFKESPADADTCNVAAMLAMSVMGERSMFMAEELRLLVARIIVNSHTLITSTMTPIGTLFDPLLALPNHSCHPTAVLTLSGSRCTLRTTRPVPQNTELTISYIDPTDARTIRQFRLHQTFHFMCTCTRCTTLPDPSLPTRPTTFPAKIERLLTSKLRTDDTVKEAIFPGGPNFLPPPSLPLTHTYQLLSALHTLSTAAADAFELRLRPRRDAPSPRPTLLFCLRGCVLAGRGSHDTRCDVLWGSAARLAKCLALEAVGRGAWDEAVGWAAARWWEYSVRARDAVAADGRRTAVGVGVAAGVAAHAGIRYVHGTERVLAGLMLTRLIGGFAGEFVERRGRGARGEFPRPRGADLMAVGMGTAGEVLELAKGVWGEDSVMGRTAATSAALAGVRDGAVMHEVGEIYTREMEKLRGWWEELLWKGETLNE